MLLQRIRIVNNSDTTDKAAQFKARLYRLLCIFSCNILHRISIGNFFISFYPNYFTFSIFTLFNVNRFVTP